VCRLKKSLYGLKQAPRQWYKKFDLFMTQHNFTKTSADHCVFVKNYANGESIILLLYVDDMLIVGKDKTKIVALKKALSKSFAMKDLGAVKRILGMKIVLKECCGCHKKIISRKYLKGLTCIMQNLCMFRYLVI